MTDAPERIWVDTWSHTNKPMMVTDDDLGGCTQYIRADLHADLLRAADELADWAWHVWETHEDAPRVLFKALTAYRKAKEKMNAKV